MKYLKPIIIIAVIIIADQLTKMWVMAEFGLYETRAIVPGFFNLTYITNTGAAFGFLAGEQNQWRQVFFVSTAIAALVVLFFAYRHFSEKEKIVSVAVCLIAAGAAGNLIDRLRFGSVVDFLDFYVGSYHWPAFNVADSCISVGIGLFLLSSFLNRNKLSEKE